MSNDDAEQTAEPGPGDAALNNCTLDDTSNQHRKPLLHTTAELQALRQSAERAAAATERRGREAVMKELLPVLDWMELLLTEPDAGMQAPGLLLAHGRVFKALARLGVTRFHVERGTRFDPLRHESIAEVYCAAIPAGDVAFQRAPGYLHDDHVLRRALVVIALDDPEKPPTLAGARAGLGRRLLDWLRPFKRRSRLAHP